MCRKRTYLDLRLGLVLAVVFDGEAVRDTLDLAHDGRLTRPLNDTDEQQFGHIRGELSKLVSTSVFYSVTPTHLNLERAVRLGEVEVDGLHQVLLEDIPDLVDLLRDASLLRALDLLLHFLLLIVGRERGLELLLAHLALRLVIVFLILVVLVRRHLLALPLPLLLVRIAILIILIIMYRYPWYFDTISDVYVEPK